MHRPKVALIGTGGTISTRSRLGSLDTVDYMSSGETLGLEEVLEAIPEAAQIADIVPFPFHAISSTAIDFAVWKALVAMIRDIERAHPDVDGVVILHGTATMEETAWFLHLTARSRLPIVMTGAQRPLGAVSSDGAANLCAAIRVAATRRTRDMGVVVCLNDEIHAARDVTKFSTNRLQTFQSPSTGPLGQVDGDGVHFYHRPVRADSFSFPLDVLDHDRLPRVEVIYSVADDDGALLRAAIGLKPAGLVIASFAGGRLSRIQAEALREARAQGVQMALSTRAGSGRAMIDRPTRESGCIPADNLNPAKARILLALALAAGRKDADIAELFSTF